MRKSIVIALSIAVVLVIAFGAFASTLSAWVTQGIDTVVYGYALPANVERRTAVIDGDRVSFLVVHVPTSMTWRLKNDPSSPKTVHEWRNELGASLVINGSYFTEANEPSGYYAINGVQSGNATCPTADPNGYTFGIYLDQGKLMTTYIPEIPETFSFCSSSVTGFASFPTIVMNDQSMIAEDSGLKARRTMLATVQGGDQQIIITESGEVTLYDVAQWLIDQPETYELVGNLDGGPSTGISISNGTKAEVNVPSAVVPNVIAGE